MNDRMEAVWRKVNEKRALEQAARLLFEKPRDLLFLKLSLSMAGGLLLALLPAAGAAREISETIARML